FTKEALVWHYLKHRNILPFLSIDSTTFSSPVMTMALVSPWMAQGSVVSYIMANSPINLYATELINDVIQGLSYLHDANIVHGDLACLSDFGLVVLVESEPTIKSPTRGSSTRWMASELLIPPSGVFKRTIASDVWAFGCVCGEVCSPFLAFNREPDLGLFDQRFGLRATQPSDGEGILMPDRLWELAQWYWNHNPAERPAVETIVDMIAEIRHEQRLKAEASLEQEHNISPIASTSGTRHIFCNFCPLLILQMTNLHPQYRMMRLIIYP
ncbi:kinase-like domain-containing protein, partial [Mycena olivaceomarginata]